MRNHKFILLFFCFLYLCSFSFIFADELDDNSEPVQEPFSDPAPVYVDITSLLTKDEDPDPDFVQKVEVQEPQLIDVNMTKTTVTPSDASGFKAVMLTILGDYETVVTDYTYQNNSNYYSHSIEIEQDYAWIASAAMLGLITYCTFRCIGGMLCKI